MLVRTLNGVLLENPAAQHERYFEDFIRQMHHFKQRIPKVLHIGLTMDANAADRSDHLGRRSILSLALLEEIELLSAVMQQAFEWADLWESLDRATYSELKDYVLFAVSKLL